MPLDRYLITSLIIWIIATIESLGGLLGFWSIIGKERFVVLLIEAAVLIALIVNCYVIKNWIYRQTEDPSHRTTAWLIFASLLLCVCGDVVNFNLPLTFYRFNDLVKHDYLVTSVLFFAPGYLLFLVAACSVAISHGLKIKTLFTLLTVASFVGITSFFSMRLPETNMFVTLVTGVYAVLITLVGASGVALVLALRKSTAKVAVYLLASGLILATVADGVIGQFWIYGNNGQGYFPHAKYINWSLYIGSQCILIHLARLAIWHKNERA